MNATRLILVFVTQILATLAQASEPTALDLDGVWRHHGATCLSGKLNRGALKDSDDFATISIDTAAKKVRSRLGIQGGNCIVVVESDLALKGETIEVWNPKVVSSNCRDRVEVEALPPSVFKFRKLASGETALIIETQPGEICSNEGRGEFILTVIPQG